jgi:putative transposase
MVKLSFTERDLRYRWSEVKRVFWEELEDQMNLIAKRLLECGLRIERSEMIGAGRYGRTSKRKDYSNGYYSRNVICKLGVLSGVLMPRSRQGVYKSQILQRYKRFGGDFDREILPMFSLGLATRRVEEFFGKFFGEYGFSHHTVSTILRQVDSELAEYKRRRLRDDVKYLFLDGFYVVIRSAFKRRYVVLFAMAEYEDGLREIVGFQAVPSEKAMYWQAFLEDLYRRGLKGSKLKLVVTDGAYGLIESVRTVYGFVPLQVCWIHRQRNVVRRITKQSHRKAICEDIKRIFTAYSRKEAIKLIHQFKEKWKSIEPKAVEIFLFDIDLSLTFYDLPHAEAKKLKSNNIIERMLREMRRRVRLVDSFRDEKSCERILFTQVLRINRKLREYAK